MSDSETPLPSPSSTRPALAQGLAGPRRPMPLLVWWWLLLLLGGTFCVVFYDLDGGAGFEPIDCWVAQTAREMQARVEAGEPNAWIIPYFSSEQRYQKSPGPYWGVMLTSRLLDQPINEATARIPNGIAAILLVLVVFWLTREIAGERAALFAGFATASSVLVLQWSHRAASDLGLAMFCTAALASLWIAYNRSDGMGRMLLVWLAYLAAGLGMLWKMPMPLAVVGCPVYVYVWWHWVKRPRPVGWWLLILLAGAVAVVGLLSLEWTGVWRVSTKLAVVAGLAATGLVVLIAFFLRAPCHYRELATHVVGMLLFLVPWLPWVLAVVQVEDTALDKWRVEYVDRFTGKLPNVEGQGELEYMFMYLMVPLIFCLPYALSLPGALWRGVAQRRDVNRDGMFAMIIWFISLLAFFTASTGKEWRYFLPALPPLFVLLGVELAILFDPSRPRRPKQEALAGWIVAIGVPAGMAAAIFVLVREWFPQVGAPSGFSLSDVLIPAIVMALIVSGGAILAVLLFLRGWRNSAFGAVVALMWGMWLWIWPTLMPVMVSQAAFKDIATQMRTKLTPAMRDDLYMIGSQDPRIMWYGDVQFPRLIDQMKLLEMQGGRRSLEREVVIYAETMLQELRESDRVLFVATIFDYIVFIERAPELAAARGVPMPEHYRWLVTERGRLDRHYVVFGNQPPPWPEPALPERAAQRLRERALEIVPEGVEALVDAVPASPANKDSE